VIQLEEFGAQGSSNGQADVARAWVSSRIQLLVVKF